jgi:arylsulfatase A-like enzyme
MLAGCGPKSAGKTFVLVTIDTLRADHLGSYGYPRGTSPRLDRLARRSLQFTDGVSVSSWTMPAMGTLATGLRPNEHGMVYWHLPLAEDCETVAEILDDAQVATAFFGNIIPHLDGLERGFNTWELRDGDDFAVVRDARKWLARTSGEDRFLWVHLLSPHGPYDPLPGTARPDVSLDPRTVAYDGEIRTTDLLIRELLDAVGEDAAVLVTADHGETLDEREGLEYEHGQRLYEELTRIPLLVRLPQGDEGLVGTTAILADVPSTVCAYFGTEAPAGAYGTSLLPATEGEPQPERATTFAFVAEDEPPRHRARRWSVRGEGYKAVFNLDEDSAVLFDLEADPRELHDVATEHPEEVEHRREQLEAWTDEAPTPRIPFERFFSPDELDRLQSLGYLGGGE